MSEFGRVVVVHDDLAEQQQVSLMLEDKGWQVHAYESAKHALTAMIEGRPPEIIITNLHLPDIDGLHFCRLLRSPAFAAFNQVPLLFLSPIFSTIDFKQATIDLGPHAFLTTPYQPFDIQDKVQALLANPKPPTPAAVFVLNDKLQVDTLGLAFRQRGYHCHIALNGQTGQKLLRQHDPDIVVLSQQLPELTHPQFLSELVSCYPEAVFILIITDPNPQQIIELLQQGVDGFVYEPFQPEYLIKLCEQIHRERALLGFKEVLEERTQKLEDNEVLFRRVVSSISDHIYVTEITEAGDHINLYLSPHIEALTGYPREAFLADWDLWPSTVIHPGDQEKAAAQAARLAKGRESEMEYRLVRANDEIIWVRDSGRSEQQGTSIITYGVVSDITQRRQLEEQLHQSQKMEAIGQLVGSIAHDFSNILMVISGHSEFLLHSHPDPEDLVYQEVEQIKEAGDRAADLIRRLLAFSRRQTPLAEILDLNQVVASLERMLRRLIGENIDLVIKLDPRQGYVKADPGQIEQILMNLVVNARDAMPKGGTLAIQTSQVRIDEPASKQPSKIPPGLYSGLAVTDTGVGMDAGTLPHVFEPFFTTKKVGKGTGLGLSIVYGIVEQNDGHILIDSKPGQGTTFRIYLPLVDEAYDSTAKQRTATATIEGTETILLVEDEASVRLVIRKFLQKQGYTVLETDQPEEALGLCRQAKGLIDLLITDVVMPDMSGRELAGHLTKIYPNLKVLYTSGYADEALNEHGLLASGITFLQKPFSSEDLARKVREALGIAQKI